MPKQIEVEYRDATYLGLDKLGYESEFDSGIIKGRLSRDDVNKSKVSIQPFHHNGKKFIYNGKEYSSIRSYCKEHDLNYHLVWSRLRVGWSFEEAINKSKQRRTNISYKGRLYKNLTELAKDAGININTFKKRLQLGNSIEECVVLQDISLKRFDNFYECECKNCGLKFIGTLEIAEKHASEHKEDYDNMILNNVDKGSLD